MKKKYSDSEVKAKFSHLISKGWQFSEDLIYIQKKMKNGSSKIYFFSQFLAVLGRPGVDF